MFRNILIALFAVAVAACPSLAQQPNLSGTWKLNVSKSDFGMVPPPESRTDVIEQNGPAFKDSVVSVGEQGKVEYALTFTADGKEMTVAPDSPNAHLGQLTLKSIAAAWQGSSLDVTEKAKFQDMDLTNKAEYSLSADGQVLTINSHIATSMGDFDTKLTFDKQGGTTAAADPPPSAATMPAGAKPNFTGTWKLNMAKSDFGPIPPPDSRVDMITDSEPSVKVNTDQKGGPQGDATYTLAFTTDGKETSGNVAGNDTKTTAHWQGNALMVDTKLNFQGSDLDIKSTWTLAPDGKALNVASHIAGPMGDLDETTVFDKQ